MTNPAGGITVAAMALDPELPVTWHETARKVKHLREQALMLEREAVVEARRQAIPWYVIGEALGVGRSTVQRQWAHVDKEVAHELAERYRTGRPPQATLNI